ncbi:hypothetical protein M569_04084 [Genlisea aurea]|uniref:Uncharacterized protein n=1 Tax=Genlisea aurea TaxID=192259 RepID=S8CV56_9LAMI|nr:hypothetical protein M569_04084 [Genlisea aurea]
MAREMIPMRSMSMKFGIALAISLGGVIYYTICRRRRRTILNSAPFQSQDHKRGESRCDEHEREIETLGNEIRVLEEKERNMEIQLLNQLRLKNMENKLHDLKIKLLVSQVDEFAGVAAELEEARVEIRDLKRKLREQQNRGMAAKSNEDLQWENSYLAQKLEYVQMLASSAMDDDEVAELKHENEDLKKRLDQLQADRNSELLHLRWENAALRRELEIPLVHGSSKQMILDGLLPLPSLDESEEYADAPADRFRCKMKMSTKRRVISKLKALLLHRKMSPSFLHGHDERKGGALPLTENGGDDCSKSSSSEYWSRKSGDFPTSSSTSLKSLSRGSSCDGSGLTSNGDAVKL